MILVLLVDKGTVEVEKIKYSKKLAGLIVIGTNCKVKRNPIL